MKRRRLPEKLTQGIAEFNNRQFFECHETLEELWVTQKDPERQFTQGIIQLAVAFYHFNRGNHDGARKLLEKGRNRLMNFLPVHLGLDVKSLVQNANDNLQKLDATPAGQRLDPELPVIRSSSEA